MLLPYAYLTLGVGGVWSFCFIFDGAMPFVSGSSAMGCADIWNFDKWLPELEAMHSGAPASALVLVLVLVL